LVSLGFTKDKLDTSLFVYRHDPDTTYMLLYINNIVLTASSPELLQHTNIALQQQFTMKDLDPLHHFLNVLVEQYQYARDILECAGKPCSTPVNTQVKVSSDVWAPINDPTSPTRSSRCLHMHDPREPHLTTAKRILHYLRGTPNHSLLLHCASMSDLVVYTDADWTGCPDTRRSTLGYTVFLGNNFVS
jgi:hypothetical protein